MSDALIPFFPTKYRFLVSLSMLFSSFYVDFCLVLLAMNSLYWVTVFKIFWHLNSIFNRDCNSVQSSITKCGQQNWAGLVRKLKNLASEDKGNLSISVLTELKCSHAQQFLRMLVKSSVCAQFTSFFKLPGSLILLYMLKSNTLIFSINNTI